MNGLCPCEGETEIPFDRGNTVLIVGKHNSVSFRPFRPVLLEDVELEEGGFDSFLRQLGIRNGDQK